MTIKPLLSPAQAATELGQDINRFHLWLSAVPMKFNLLAEPSMRCKTASATTSSSATNAGSDHARFANTTDTLMPASEKVSDADLRDKLISRFIAHADDVKEGLDLARSMDSSEELRPLDIDSLLDSICSDAGDAGHTILASMARLAQTIMASPTGAQTLPDNLIGQWHQIRTSGRCRHLTRRKGQYEARWQIGLHRDPRSRPGIPEDQQARVFEPLSNRKLHVA